MSSGEATAWVQIIISAAGVIVLVLILLMLQIIRDVLLSIIDELVRIDRD